MTPRTSTQLATRPLVDVGIAAIALVATLAMIAHGFGASRPGRELDLLGVILVAASTLPLIAWRRAPLIVSVATGVGAAVVSGLGYRYPLGIPLGATLALYLLATGNGKTHWTNRTTTTVLGMLVLYLCASALAESSFPWFELQHTALAWAVAWFAGERTRLLRERLAELADRAATAERAAERERRLAVAEERARIARDLHDSAGHAINLIAVRAGAARLRHPDDPKRSLAALYEIEEVARQTAAELDGIVHSLRENSLDGAPAPPIGLASFSSLIGYHSRSGLKLAVTTSGTARQLGHATDQAAYRILQEALTNAARHGSGHATIELDYEPAALHLTVTNPALAGSGTDGRIGHGLIGMKERATLVGGSLEVERSDGRFSISARLPYDMQQECREF